MSHQGKLSRGDGMAGTPINVTISLATLFCYHGADEDGSSEPYLWTIMFALDGGSIVQAGTKLTGAPRYFFSPGSHGNLGSTADVDQTLIIPPPVGTWTTNLQPISLVLPSGQTILLPGQIGVIALLMEENDTPNDAVEAGHQALNKLVQTQLQQFIDGLDTGAIGALISEITGPSPSMAALTAAAIQVFNQLFTPVKNNIMQFAPSAIEAAIANSLNLIGGLGTIISADERDGQIFYQFTQDQLTQSNVGSKIVFSDFLSGDTSPFPAWGYNLHGEAYQRIEVWYTPVASTIPPGRWQISSVDKARVSGHGYTWITHVGGQLTDGSFWRVARGDAIDLINKGINTFFVLGPDQSQAEVKVVPDDPKIQHPYLKTVADKSVEDNLTQLPPCVQSIQHQTNV